MARIYKTPFAATGDKEVLASTDQPDGKVSLPAGWTNDYQLPDTDPNYRPVGRAEMNGVFNEVTEALGEVQLNGFAEWQALSGGYPLNAEIKKNGVVYHSMTAANTDDPSAAGANWQPTNSYGVTVKSLTTGTVTLTSEEAARGTVILSGTLTGNVTVIFPKYLSQWVVRNNTTGAFSVTAKTLAGTGVIVPQGESRYIFGDGSNLINSGDFVPISGAVTKSGVLTLTNSPKIPDAVASNEPVALGQGDARYRRVTVNSVTGTATFTKTTNNINLTGIGSIGLEVGDVVTVSGTANNNKLFTVEVITDANNIIVNQAHAGGTTTKSLVDETVSATVTLLANWYNAPVGLGQGYVELTTNRALNVTYTNPTGRALVLRLSSSGGSGNIFVTVDGASLGPLAASTPNVYSQLGEIIIPIGSTYRTTPSAGAVIAGWQELR